MKRIALTFAALAVFAVAASSAFGVVTLASNVGCPDGHACLWTQTNYNGSRDELGRGFNNNNWADVSDAGPFHSAKNRLGFSGVGAGLWLANGPPGNRTWSDCVGNQSERPTPGGTINWVRVDQLGC